MFTDWLVFGPVIGVLAVVLFCLVVSLLVVVFKPMLRKRYLQKLNTEIVHGFMKLSIHKSRKNTANLMQLLDKFKIEIEKSPSPLKEEFSKKFVIHQQLFSTVLLP
jgi:hypothetical protein